MHRVLYFTLDGDTSRAQEVLEQKGMDSEIELVGCAHNPFDTPTPEQLEGIEAVIGEFMPVTGHTVENFANAGVRLVASQSIGINHIDTEGLAKAGVLVSNCPGYCAEDVAAHTIALMLDMLRKVTLSNRDVLDGNWDPKVGYAVHRPSALTLGLVFFGRIAKAVVPVAKALGMRVVVWAPTKSAEELAAAGCEKVETLDELLGQSDVVSLHCPLIPETEKLLSTHEFEIMKSSAFLVNTARGGCVDEDALLAALNEHIESNGERGIRAAALDVLVVEAGERNEALINHPSCIVTPHTAYDSIEAVDALCEMSIEACIELLVEGKRPTYCVN